MPKVTVDLDALRRVVDYLWDVEAKHYDETTSSEPPDSPVVRGHIFRTLQHLRSALPEGRSNDERKST